MGAVFASINNFTWQNQHDLMEFEHCKPAPFVSSKFLCVLRVFISVSLLVESVACIWITDWDSIKYFSEWALYGATILFALMAYVQVKTTKEVKDFTLDDVNQRRQSYLQDDLENEVNTSNFVFSSNWKWIIYFYQLCFVSCLLASFVFWVTIIFFDNTFDISGEHDFAVLCSLHIVPSGLMLLEYPFNMIPWDWRFLPLNLFVMILYLIDTVLFQVIQDTPVYSLIDWDYQPAKACGVYFLFCLGMILIFAAMWFLT